MMAQRKPLVLLDNNLPAELPSGDTIEGAEVAYIDGGNFSDSYVSAPFAVDGGTFA